MATTPKPKTYWSGSLKRAVTVPEDDERPRIDELLTAADNLLAAIQLADVTPTDAAARYAWHESVCAAQRAVAALK